MYELVFLQSAISKNGLKNGPKSGPKNGPKKINAIESPPRRPKIGNSGNSKSGKLKTGKVINQEIQNLGDLYCGQLVIVLSLDY